MALHRDRIANDNICVIWVDDLIDVFTWREQFGVTIQTPNIDRLMARGTRFSNAYATVPLCAPCRAELATGLSPYRTGLVDLNRLWREVLPPTAGWQFDLRRAGFRTFTTGKVDGGYKPMPQDYRRILFHAEPGAADRGGRRNVHRYGRGPSINGVGHPDDDGAQDAVFYDASVARNAIAYLDKADPARRHLIQLGFKHPHYPLEAPDRFYQLYDPAAIRWPASASPEDFHGPQPGMAVYEAAYIANGSWTPERAGDEGWRQVVRAYFACCSHVDHEIGRFLDALDASPLGASTTVIFLSDNGFNLGTHDSFHKMSQWDSAAHVPLGIVSPRMDAGTVVDLPVSLHNLPRTILDLAGLPPRPDWTSGQSLLPLLDGSFGTYDRAQSPLTSVFGTLSVRPSTEGLTQYRYFRYPNGEEHVYDLVADPGETRNLADTAPMAELRAELVAAAARLGLDLSGLARPAAGVNAMMVTDGSVVLEGGAGDTAYWAYGRGAERIREEAEGGNDTLWYLGGPDDYVVEAPAHVEAVRIGTVLARSEGVAVGPASRRLRVRAHPDQPLLFETSERVGVHVTGASGDDTFLGGRYASAEFHGRGGDDQLLVPDMNKGRNRLYGGAGNDLLTGGTGRDTLDGGTGDDTLIGRGSHNLLVGGFGNDVIEDGGGGSVIHTGPGRNRVVSAGGSDLFHVGPGSNDITPGPGAALYMVAYGGVTRIRAWRPEYGLDLSGWPARALVEERDGSTRITLGLSLVDIARDLTTPLRLRLPGDPPLAEVTSSEPVEASPDDSTPDDDEG